MVSTKLSTNVFFARRRHSPFNRKLLPQKLTVLSIWLEQLWIFLQQCINDFVETIAHEDCGR
jgi:hypothetical protein